ncbi:MAG: PAS domain S-box protein [Candidatus Rifleibacteriota bacterium]
MIYLELVFNLTLLIALSIVSGFIDKRFARQTAIGKILQGALFGGAAVLGMYKPLDLGAGLIFDGRSMMISLSALYFGPLAGFISGAMSALVRYSIGGIGLYVGVMVIISSFGIGLTGHYFIRPASRPPSSWILYWFGIVVHLAMMLIMLFLPDGSGWEIMRKIGPPVMLLYPLATVLAGKLLSDQITSLQMLQNLFETKEKLEKTLQSIGEAVLATDENGRVILMNPAAENLTGWKFEEAQGREACEVFKTTGSDASFCVDNPLNLLADGNLKPGKNIPVQMIDRSGVCRPVSSSLSPVKDNDGKVLGLVLVLSDQSQEFLAVKIAQARERLLKNADNATSQEISQIAIDEMARLSQSLAGMVFQFDKNRNEVISGYFNFNGKTVGTGRVPVEFRQIEEKLPLLAQALQSGHFQFANSMVSGWRMFGAIPDEFMRCLAISVHNESDSAEVFVLAERCVDYADNEISLLVEFAEMVWQIREKRLAEEQLKESEKLFRVLFEKHSAVKLIVEPFTGKILDANQAAAKFYGWSQQQLRQMNIGEINTLSPEDLKKALTSASSGLKNYFEFSHRRADDSIREVEVFIGSIELGGRSLLYSIIHDVTERKKIEGELRQAQKMETVGRLAGGVAHDFNNMLSVISGYAEFALEQVESGSPVKKYLGEIIKATNRSIDLTRQLLAFARKQTIYPQVVSLNDRVEDMLKMLRHLIGEGIKLVWLPESGLWPTKIDPTQVEQILANLCVNARDAIKGIGKICIETANFSVDEEQAGQNSIPTGDFVLLKVVDDGCGIPKENLVNIFEPFFTTKDLNSGTGLGLATVFGIVKQNGGFIKVDSEVGQGTTFRVFLPRYSGDEIEVRAEKESVTFSGNDEMILLVEDEIDNLSLYQQMLERINFKVLPASSPNEAMRLASLHSHEIKLLITDVVMPEMNGRELAERLLKQLPHLKILFMSGYTDNILAGTGVLEERTSLIQKPFTLSDLSIKIKKILEKKELGNGNP